MNEIEIGMISCWYQEKSCGNFTYRLSGALERNGAKVQIMSSNCLCYRDNPFCDDLFLSDCRKVRFADYYWAPHTRFGNYLRMIPRLVGDALKGRQYVTEMKFPILDYQQTQGSFGFLPLLSFLTSPTHSKRVITIHEIDSVQNQLKIRNLNLNTIPLNRVYNRANRIIVQNSAMRDAIMKLGVRLEKISIVPHGTFIPPLKSVDRDQIIFCGGHKIAKGKGLETFLQAVSMFKQESVPLKVVIYGLNSEYGQEEGKKLSSQLGISEQIRWFDYNFKDGPLNNEFQRSMMMVIPYTSSEAGAQVTSAMANGVPVIATPNVGLPEYLGQSGFFIKENDTADLVHKMKLLFVNSELRARFGAQLRQRAIELFSWDVIGRKTHDLFKEILKEPEFDASDWKGNLSRAGFGVL